MNKSSHQSTMPTDVGMPVTKRYPKRRNIAQKGGTKKAVVGPMSAGRGRNAQGAPSTAAKGDDDLMSQPVKDMNLRAADGVKIDKPSRVRNPTSGQKF